MSAYTPDLVRLYIDDLDAVFREAVTNKSLRQAFEKEKGRVGSLMKAIQETRGMLEIQTECNRPRFLFVMMAGLNGIRGDKTKLGRFWDRQEEEMRRFDNDHPNDHPPAGMPLPPAVRPQFPLKPVPVMIAQGSKPRATMAANLSSPKPAATLPPPKPAATLPSPKPAATLPPKKPAATPSARTKRPFPAPGTMRQPLKRVATKEGLPGAGSDDDAEGSDDEETDEEEKVERRRKKGKGREVDVESVPEERKHDRQPAGGGEGRWKRPEVKTTGEEREHPCERCNKINRPCLKQSGGLIACVDCAKVKMKCVPMSGEIPATQPPKPPKPPKPSKIIFRPGTLTRPTAAASVTQKPAPKPTPGPSSIPSKRPAPQATGGPANKRVKKTSGPAPAPTGSKKKTVKSSEMVASSDESEPAPAATRSKQKFRSRVESSVEEPAPAPAATRRPKKTKSPVAESSDEEPAVAATVVERSPTPPVHDSAWPKAARNFKTFESYYSKFL